MRRRVRQQGVAANISRRHLLCAMKMAPTDVGGYAGAEYSSQERVHFIKVTIETLA